MIQQAFNMTFDGATSGDYQAVELLPAGNPGFWRAKLEIEADPGNFDPDENTQTVIFKMTHGIPSAGALPVEPSQIALWSPGEGAGGDSQATWQINRKTIVDYDLLDGQALTLRAEVVNPVVSATFYVKTTLVKLGD
jgi:hypothetical protein